ncbi:MAG TPA: hypothetical protein PLX66_02255 [Bacilli bacterium]|nr:hypothetical protein [Bacilli bacterium]
MAILTWEKDFNNYDINLKFLCHYKDGFITEFDSHDMSDNINNLFNLMETSDYQEVIKMDFLKLAKYLFKKIPNLSSVEFISDNSKSEYFIDDII